MRPPNGRAVRPLNMLVTESCAEYRLRLRGNSRDKDMPRYDLNIAILDTIRYIVPSLVTVRCDINSSRKLHCSLLGTLSAVKQYMSVNKFVSGGVQQVHIIRGAFKKFVD